MNRLRLIDVIRAGESPDRKRLPFRSALSPSPIPWIVKTQFVGACSSIRELVKAPRASPLRSIGSPLSPLLSSFLLPFALRVRASRPLSVEPNGSIREFHNINVGPRSAPPWHSCCQIWSSYEITTPRSPKTVASDLRLRPRVRTMRPGLGKPGALPLLALIVFSLLTLVPSLSSIYNIKAADFAYYSTGARRTSLATFWLEICR